MGPDLGSSSLKPQQTPILRKMDKLCILQSNEYLINHQTPNLFVILSAIKQPSYHVHLREDFFNPLLWGILIFRQVHDVANHAINSIDDIDHLLLSDKPIIVKVIQTESPWKRSRSCRMKSMNFNGKNKQTGFALQAKN